MKTVTFTMSLGRGTNEVTMTLDELGIFESDFTSELELRNLLQEAYEDWVWGNLDTTWYIEDSNDG